MGITQIAVMPLQVLVDFFAPQSPQIRSGATKNIAAYAGIYWARSQLGAKNPGANNTHNVSTAGAPSSTPRRARVCERPWASSTKASTKTSPAVAVTRIVRAGFAVQTLAQDTAHSGPTASPLQPPSHSVRLRRTLETSDNAQLAGRMVISGRMRDVCDELNRLSA